VSGRHDRPSRPDDGVESLFRGCQVHGNPPFVRELRRRHCQNFQPAPPTVTMVTTAPAAIANRVSMLRTDKHPFHPVGTLISVSTFSGPALAHTAQFSEWRLGPSFLGSGFPLMPGYSGISANGYRPDETWKSSVRRGMLALSLTPTA
jgi:hypothetical protein